jgi:pimeloyl-ACP methyl ester carboxylesterase
MICDESLPTTKSFDGAKISYSKDGEKGSNIILIHGWSCDGTYWKKTTPSLKGDHQVYTIDLAGHGKSGKNRSEWTMEAYGEDVKALMDKEKLTDTILVGHSMGGDVALAATQILGDRVKGVLLVDTYHRITLRPEQRIQEMLTPFRENFRDAAKPFVYGMFTKEADPELVESIALDMSDQDPSVGYPSLDYCIRYDEAAAFDRIMAPIRCINCDTEPSDFASAKKHSRDFEGVIMTSVGHFLMLEKPEEFNLLLRKMIDELYG